MTRPWSFDLRRAEVPNPYERGGDTMLYVEQYECPDCGWRSGWHVPARAHIDAMAHNKVGCDCRLVPRNLDDALRHRDGAICPDATRGSGDDCRHPDCVDSGDVQLDPDDALRHRDGAICPDATRGSGDDCRHPDCVDSGDVQLDPEHGGAGMTCSVCSQASAEYKRVWGLALAEYERVLGLHPHHDQDGGV